MYEIVRHPSSPSTLYQLTVPVRGVAEPMLPLAIAFGRALQRLRASTGYSVEQLGARAGLSAVRVAAIERGEEIVSLAMLERLAGALGIRVSEMICEAERQRAL